MSEPAVTIPAAYGVHPGNLPITRVVIHDEEYPVGPGSAEAVAQFFAGPSAQGSAHYVEDQDSEQHCVAEDHVAAHAPPNTGSVGIEQDGYAHCTPADWATPGSTATIKRTAARTADICDRRGVPKVWLNVADLLAGRHGITSHANVSAAFHQSDHTDPGPNYPVAWFMQLVLGIAPEPHRNPLEDETVQIVFKNEDAEPRPHYLAAGMFYAHIASPETEGDYIKAGVPGPTGMPAAWFAPLFDLGNLQNFLTLVVADASAKGLRLAIGLPADAGPAQTLARIQGKG